MNELYFKNVSEWHMWLESNHLHAAPVWLVYYKKETGQPTMEYEESVQEALCYGWIDGLIKNLDEERYIRRFSRRLAGSKWSETNKKRIEKLIGEGRMAAAGIAAVESARKDGSWDQPARPELDLSMPDDLKAELQKNKPAGDYFNTLSPSQRKNYIGWIVSAKRNTTRLARIKESIQLLSKNRPLGMK